MVGYVNVLRDTVDYIKVTNKNAQKKFQKTKRKQIFYCIRFDYGYVEIINSLINCRLLIVETSTLKI